MVCGVFLTQSFFYAAWVALVLKSVPSKNLVLAGVGELILDDSTICSAEDLASQFYIRPEDVAKSRTRAQASRQRLASLNPHVRVSIAVHSLTAASVDIGHELNNLLDYELHCMVVTDIHLFFAALLNNYCRQHHIKFVYANTIGVFGNVFCDFGPCIKFSPPDEEPPSTFFIENIENAEKPKLVIRGSDQHKLPDGGLLTFHEVTGMVELNGRIVQAMGLSPHALELNVDTRNFGEFSGNGLAIEVKQALEITHLPLAKQLEDPKLSIVDLVNPDSAAQMHVAFLALMAFIYIKKQFPKPWSRKDAAQFLKLAERFCVPKVKINNDLLARICFTSRGQLPPLCSFFGGVAAQEVIKAVTHRFTPLNQWVRSTDYFANSLLYASGADLLLLSQMYFGADSLIPSEVPGNPEISIDPRYVPLLRCIGPQNMRKVTTASAFMVGCGAIGCELLKNLALLGLATGAPLAAITELTSNLSNSTISPSFDDETSAISSEIVDDGDNEELVPLIIRDFHHMVIELSHLGMELGTIRPYQLDHGDTVPVADSNLDSTPRASLDDHLDPHSPSATRGTMTALLTDMSTGTVTAVAGPQGESATELLEDENIVPLGSPASSSSASLYRIDERELLRLPMITRVSSQSDYDADVESVAQQTFSCPQPTITTTVVTNTDANTNAITCDAFCITITDMDHIEKSNLNRQFLFQSEHVGQAKSTVAAESIRQINPALRVVALQEKLDSDTEKEVFTDDFLQKAASGKDKSGPPIVLSALDNVKGRRYLDTRCVANRLVMFDSGTQGTKGHTQVILPGITESYSSQKDLAEEEGTSDVVPYCTLKSFPAKVSDCVEWAREKFFTQFTLKPQVLDRLFSAFRYSRKELRDALQQMLTQVPPDCWSNDTTQRNILLQNLNTPQLAFFNNRPRTWRECVCLAREKFEKYFAHKALHLLYKFPADKVLDGGEPFWQLPRRKPRPLTFDVSNKLHIDFVWSFARLLCKQMDIQLPSVSTSATASSLVKEALINFSPRPYVQSDKEVIVDTSVSRPMLSNGPSSCLIADGAFHLQLEIAIAILSKPDCTFSIFILSLIPRFPVIFKHFLDSLLSVIFGRLFRCDGNIVLAANLTGRVFPFSIYLNMSLMYFHSCSCSACFYW
ncbi:unnamed protein product [Hydatigera taeniaeformis]|uniref:UBA_e1_C domain-containing protein n=1 Tax=Hydatigena taeniaeformis TaxID=6205 RepID=A0A0R3WJF7_HYDTA|nr:unnamed protein product [Hydatigera taeniaeformis]